MPLANIWKKALSNGAYVDLCEHECMNVAPPLRYRLVTSRKDKTISPHKSKIVTNCKLALAPP